MDKQLVILDINNNKYTVKDVKRFSDHIFKFHATGVSIHEENGYIFKINDDLRYQILLYMKNLNL